MLERKTKYQDPMRKKMGENIGGTQNIKYEKNI